MSNNLVHVRHGNVFLDISPEAVEKYMAKGFDIVDERGNVIKECIPSDVNSLRAAYDKHVAKIAELEKQVADLKAQLSETKKISAPKAVVKAEKEQAEVDDIPVEKPAKKTKKTK